MLRKKRREKDGHKDPLLMEVSRLQDSIMKDIAELHKETEEAEKKQSELDKVAQILGIDIFDKSLKSSNDSKESTEKPEKEKSKSPEKELSPSNSSSSNKVMANFLVIFLSMDYCSFWFFWFLVFRGFFFWGFHLSVWKDLTK